MREIISIIEARTQPDKLETTPLPYAQDALSPVLSKDSIDYHYEHLAKSYARRYNNNEGDANFNRAGSFLHNKFFPQLQPPKSTNRPRGNVLELIERKFKSYENFQEQVKKTAMSIQGSGWVYLSTAGELKVIKNHSVRTDIALLLDMWEHAFALDYQWDKEKYIDNFWRIINWDVVNDRL
jgi:Fe-Mn family superoxide dismutase